MHIDKFRIANLGANMDTISWGQAKCHNAISDCPLCPDNKTCKVAKLKINCDCTRQGVMIEKGRRFCIVCGTEIK